MLLNKLTAKKTYIVELELEGLEELLKNNRFLTKAVIHVPLNSGTLLK